MFFLANIFLQSKSDTDSLLAQELEKIRTEISTYNSGSESLFWTAFIIGMIISGIAIISTFINSFYLNKQTTQLKEEIHNRMRPILGRDTSNSQTCVIMENNQFFLRFKNHGILPAIDVSAKFFIELKGMSGIIKRLPNQGYDEIPLASLGVGESLSFLLFDDDEFKAASKESRKLNFELELSYTDFNKKTQYCYGVTGGFDRDNLVVDKTKIT